MARILEKEELDSLKAELPVAKWNAQYQQDPTSEEGALIKRDWWQEWTKNDLPLVIPLYNHGTRPF